MWQQHFCQSPRAIVQKVFEFKLLDELLTYLTVEAIESSYTLANPSGPNNSTHTVI